MVCCLKVDAADTAGRAQAVGVGVLAIPAVQPEAKAAQTGGRADAAAHSFDVRFLERPELEEAGGAAGLI